MAVNQDALDALQRANEHVPRIIRTFLRVLDLSQQELGDGIGMTQSQVSRRLSTPGALAQAELAGLAAYFGVPIETFYKSEADAVADLYRSTSEAIRDLLIRQKGCIEQSAA